MVLNSALFYTVFFRNNSMVTMGLKNKFFSVKNPIL